MAAGINKCVLGTVVSKQERVLEARFMKEMKEAFLHDSKEQFMYTNYRIPNLISQWFVAWFCVHSVAIHHLLCTNSVDPFFF